MKRPRRALVALLALSALLSPRVLHAYFERPILSSRYLSLGESFVSLADDATAVVINPAGMVNAPRIALLSTYLRPYGLDDVSESFAAASAVTRHGAFGASWHRRELSGALTQDLITVAYARDLVRNVSNESLSLGASVDLARVSAVDRFDASDAVVTGSLSLLVRPFGGVGFGYCIRNVAPQTIALLDGPGTRLSTTHALGLSYRLEDKLTVVAERRRGMDNQWRSSGGIELIMGQGVTLRGGFGEPGTTLGGGYQFRGVAVDVGVASDEYLGTSYIVSLSYGRRAANPYGQTQ